MLGHGLLKVEADEHTYCAILDGVLTVDEWTSDDPCCGTDDAEQAKEVERGSSAAGSSARRAR